MSFNSGHWEFYVELSPPPLKVTKIVVIVSQTQDHTVTMANPLRVGLF